MKPIDTVRALTQDKDRCRYCLASPPSRSNPYFCYHPQVGEYMFWDKVWDGVTEPCTLEDWNSCPFKALGKTG